MADKLFNETFFKKNDYFRKELNLSKDQLKEIQSLIKNWQKNCESFNPDVDKETTDENEFVDILFKKILGYSGKGKDADNYNILPKFKIDGASATGKAGYADLSLGYFSKSPFSKGGQGGISAEVVIEFKGQDSDNLTKLSNRPDKLSPVDQCWKYLVNHASAKWGIVTNFNEIRIYNKEKGQNVYETFYFNVPEEEKHKFLPLSTETEILKLITILKKENLLTTNGVSKTGELLKNKGVEETKVLKEFYLEYKSLRSQIFYEALKYNTQYEIEKPKSELLQLVQKFLDRIIFCWFCEDSREHLIPSNILSADLIQTQAKDKYYNPQHFSIYGKVKDLFQAIDEGRAFGIDSGYNGELFKPDAALDALKLPNFLFEKIAEIGMQYDFGDENELNVNILGHIFEQSISDLEEMRVSFQELDQTPRKIEKQHVMEFAKEVDVLEHKHTEFDAKKTKRKKEGVFYTPDYITRYIVENTVGVWLKDKEAEVTKKYSSLKKNKEYTILREYRDEHLSKIKILDPACGSGAFLIAAFNYLWKEHERVYTEIKEIKNKTAQGELFDFDSINKTILENNLYGVDLNRESVEITKLALWLKTAAKNKKLNSLHNNIKCGNSLIDDKSVAGELAFDWKKEFPSIMNADGFDVVVGNPPYGAELKENQINTFQYKYKSFGQNNDIYTCFYENTHALGKNQFIAGFITPVSWQTNEKYLSLRTYFIDNFNLNKAIKLPYDIFEDAYIDTGIYIFTNKKKVDYQTLVYDFHPKEKMSSDTLFKLNFQVLESKVWQKNKNSIIVLNANYYTLNTKITINSINLAEISQSIRGILASPSDILEKKVTSNHKPYFLGDVYRYQIYDNQKWVDYGVNLKEKPNDYSWFTGERILIRRIISRKFRIMATYTSEEFVNKKDLYILKIIDTEYDIKFILTLLNSNLFSFLKTKGSTNATKDDFSQITLSDVRNLPIKNISPKDQKPFIRLADSMLTKNKELQEIQKKFTTLLVSEFKIEKLTEKLEDWYLLDWSEFAGELKKKKITLSAKDEEKWLDRFERLRKEALAIKGVIDSTDKEIDQMVYELYGLTKDEIGIVEDTGK